MKRRGRIPDLYYYTTVETMRFILQNANIYATDLKYMNDSEEYTNGLRELREIINSKYGAAGRELITEKRLDENIKAHSEIYSISFSVERDLLSQWSMYAKESGVSLRLNFNKPMEYHAYPEAGDGRSREKVTSLDLYPRKVYYFTKGAMAPRQYGSVREQIIKTIEHNYGGTSIADIESNAVEIWQDMTPFIKRYEFKAEGEFRLVFSMRTLPKKFRVDYRNDKHVLKPYLDVECHGGWPVKEIIVGPGFNQQATYDSIRHFMEHARLKLPSMTGKQFQLCCREFLRRDNKIPPKAEELWDKKKEALRDRDKKRRYGAFDALLNEIYIAEEISDEYKKYVDNRFLTEAGVLVSKSEIPYIY